MPRAEDIDRRTFLQYGGTAAVAASSVALAGCPADEPADDVDDTDDDVDDTDDGVDDDVDEEEFHVTVTQGPLTDTLDPVGDNSTPVYNIIDQAYEPFLYRDRDGAIIERIVTDWERVGDNEVRLEVRDGVTFHSGNEMTPEDVAYSINRANDPDVSAVAGVIGAIEEARVEDGAVHLDLEQVEPVIFRNLTAFGRVVEQAWVEDNDGDIDTIMNGTGPYELEEFVDDTRVVYDRFDDYWGEAPEPDGGTYNSAAEDSTRIDRLLAGESDIITAVPPGDIPEIDDADDVSSEFIASIRCVFLVHNDSIPPFDSREFRQAMNYAVDVEAIIDSILFEFGQATSQPTLEGHVGHNPDLEPYPYDPEQAEQLIDESGYADEEITLHTPVGRYVRDADVAETAAGMIDDLPNVTCDVERRDFGALVGELLDPDPETAPAYYLIGWGNPTLDANYTVGPWMGFDGIWRFFHNDELSDLMHQANEEADDEAREELLQEANRIAHEEAAWTFLHQEYSIYGTSDRIEWEAREDEDVLLEHVHRA